MGPVRPRHGGLTTSGGPSRLLVRAAITTSASTVTRGRFAAAEYGDPTNSPTSDAVPARRIGARRANHLAPGVSQTRLRWPSLVRLFSNIATPADAGAV